jgi:hypothetical protein
MLNIGYYCQPRRVAHSTNTTHQYIATAVRACSSKAIASLSAVPNKAYTRTITESLSAGKAYVKGVEMGIALNRFRTPMS